MAGSSRSDSGARRPRKKLERKTIGVNISIKISRRKLTLITITTLLNVLLWSSVICIAACVVVAATDPSDTTNIAPLVLTSTSALVTLAYTFFHTIISIKQRIWKHQRRDPSAMRRTSYVAIRLVISLCVLWLLTCGWNMILVARRPICLSEGAPGLGSWEFGTVCGISRVSMAFGVIALVASCTLFGVLGAVRRPFEAHLFKYSYLQSDDVQTPPSGSERTTPERGMGYSSEKGPYARRRSNSTRRSSPDRLSNTDVETIDLNSSPPPTTIHAPSPVRVGMGIFTSRYTPPPIPSAYAGPPRSSSAKSASVRASSLDLPPPFFQPSISHMSLSRPPRLSGHVATSGFVPLSIQPQYSASAWKAVHPESTPTLRSTRSHSQINNGGFTYRSRYSRSSVSLTRPHRLSTATPPVGSVAWSSRSGSTGPEGRESPLSGSGEDRSERRATATEIAIAIMNGYPIPGTTQPLIQHKRTSSAPDTQLTAAERSAYHQMARGWKQNSGSPEVQPHRRTSHEIGVQSHRRTSHETGEYSRPRQPKPAKLAQSSSAGFLSRFSPDTSPDDEYKSHRYELEREIDIRNSRVLQSARRSRSNDQMMPESSNPAEAAATMLSRMPQDLRMSKVRNSRIESPYENGNRMTMTFDDVKNKPLPKIAVL